MTDGYYSLLYCMSIYCPDPSCSLWATTKRPTFGVLESLPWSWPLAPLPTQNSLPWRFVPSFSLFLITCSYTVPTLESVFVLCCGHHNMQVLMLTLENPPPTLETCGDLNRDEYKKHYSKSFQKMVEKCLQRDPAKRYCIYVCSLTNTYVYRGQYCICILSIHPNNTLYGAFTCKTISC